ncbi:hypothetical protein DFH11DRAFT_1604359 [Phellopilus nigrolimitatus]|nr:hypothetical protein DFH11DRAFT_1604359 [Phellopilus nigrolimitatus]
MAPKLPLQAKRWRTIIVTLPVIGATSFVLYQRLVLGTPQRTLPKPESQPLPSPRQSTEKSAADTQI